MLTKAGTERRVAGVDVGQSFHLLLISIKLSAIQPEAQQVALERYFSEYLKGGISHKNPSLAFFLCSAFTLIPELWIGQMACSASLSTALMGASSC